MGRAGRLSRGISTPVCLATKPTVALRFDSPVDLMLLTITTTHKQSITVIASRSSPAGSNAAT
jgi:hypothetical protein